MIILDTNVVSEPMRARPDDRVRNWLDRQVSETLYLTTTSLSELPVGIEMLAIGRRGDGLAVAVTSLIERLFGERVLPFDHAAAVAYASVVSRARSRGHAVGIGDGQIAAIASAHDFTVATRNGAPFTSAGIAVIDPWTAP